MKKDRVIYCAVAVSLIILSVVVYQKYTHIDIVAGRHGTRAVPSQPIINRDIWASQENWTRPRYIPDYIMTLSQGDAKLVDYISQHWVLPPSTLPLKLHKPNRVDFSQNKQSQLIDKLMGQMENGFFVESGAANGEVFSNSLFFEKSRNWTGVLIEAEPQAFDEMTTKHRHSFLVHACLSPTTKAMKIPFRIGGVIGALSNYMSNTHARRMDSELGREKITVNIQCFPMFSILKAIGVTHVDFFSLDIEGAEPEVLQTLPMDQMTVDVFCIEHNSDAQKLKAIKDLLVVKHGYTIITEHNQDIILKRKGF
jgi:hypothetical protein